MANRRALVAVSAVQLTAGLVGQVVALRRRRHYDIPFMTGSAEHVGRDSWWFGTAISAPSYMLASQAWGIARLLRDPADDRGRQVLRLLGTGMVAGYLSERLCRHRLTPGGFDPVETPIVAAGFGGTVAMALLSRP
ncbi:hypothetical protein [Blastococcus haudaquaticus]|uniref:DUF4345 domain-containing protein n=1 Tax=Blastococcus haudaquaticus TaxID=1938745 RepID=A0A286GH32_9ACTN|nr:hypothetical protein [Blastococcus haudaquaticus]SOD94782.1 hypothetical protein SAMN06272739_0991 [Blastococcus haudaquaticus]